MGDFRTELFPASAPFNITYQSVITAIGSCFTQHIGAWMENVKFNCKTNPFGILFHPIAIANCIERIVHQKEYTEEEVQFNNELYCSFDHHSSFNHPDKATFLHNVNSRLIEFKNHLEQSDSIIITLGTAWAYRHLNSGKIVANCHKINANQFTKELLSMEQVVDALQSTYALLNKSNVRFVFTVSPVRHLKDGFVENQLSKSILITAIHEFMKDKQNCYYFPAYEIMMDDLRDYRFYSEDMLHPNAQAINYIKEKFATTFIPEKDRNLIEQVEKVRRDMAHRPFHQNSIAYEKFQDNLKKSINILEENNIYFSHEI